MIGKFLEKLQDSIVYGFGPCYNCYKIAITTELSDHSCREKEILRTKSELESDELLLMILGLINGEWINEKPSKYWEELEINEKIPWLWNYLIDNNYVLSDTQNKLGIGTMVEVTYNDQPVSFKNPNDLFENETDCLDYITELYNET